MIIRGLPGSGKSTFAKLMAKERGYDHLDGVFRFDPTKLAAAHKWCHRCTEISLMAGRDVVVSNTFVKRAMIAPYIDLAKKFGAQYREVTATGDFGSVHGVPRETIARMAAEWEQYDSAYTDRFLEWVKETHGPNPPAILTINLNEMPFYISPLYGSTVEMFKALQKHNSKVGVFGG
jgi:hypothetical protein